jgi:hypothetical protein
MDSNLSTLIVIVLACVGALVWLAGLLVMTRATRDRRTRAQEATTRFDIEDAMAGGTIVGESEVEGRPEDLSARLARLLARDGMGPFGPVKIVACDAKELIFESAGASPGSPGRTPDGVHGGRFRFTPTGSLTRVEYAIEAPSGRGVMAAGWLFIVLGFVALLGGCWAVFTYVLPSPSPNVRGQAFQIVQAVHFLWPPFLFATLARQPARMIQARVGAMVHNLPYS